MKKILAVLLVIVMATPCFAGVNRKVEGDTSKYLTKAEVNKYMAGFRQFTTDMGVFVGELAEKRISSSFERVIAKATISEATLSEVSK